MTKERKGEIFIAAGGVLWSIFPILTVLSLSKLAPLVSLAWTTLFAAVFFAIIMAKKGRWQEIKNRTALKYMLWILVSVTALYGFLFFGLKFTTPGNASLIGLTEVFFSFLLFNVWRKHHIAGKHIIGALLTLTGAAIVLLPNVHAFNPGDLLILIGTAVAPVGNYFQQKARKEISSETMMFVRSALSFPILFLLAYALGNPIHVGDLRTVWISVAMNGFILFGLSKIFWIEGINLISVTKANAMSGFQPLLTLLLAWLILGQAPTWFQLSALLPLFFGLMLLTYRKEAVAAQIP